jgi:hypothetical protein
LFACLIPLIVKDVKDDPKKKNTHKVSVINGILFRIDIFQFIFSAE